MLTLIKIAFIVIAGIFLVSLIDDQGFIRDFSIVDTGDGSVYGVPDSVPAERGAYTRSYDTNDDGTISDREYERGERERVDTEIERIRTALAEALANERESPYADMIYLAEGGVKESDPDEEYIEVRANLTNEASVTITGWTLKSLASRQSARIGEGVPPSRSSLSGRSGRTVALKASERAYVISGDPRSRDTFIDDTGTLSGDDWLVILDTDRNLWRSSNEAILLLDQHGLVVDYLTY